MDKFTKIPLMFASFLLYSLFFAHATMAIKVLSYNICWECMSGSSEGSAGKLGQNCIKITKNKINFTTCAENIATQIDNFSEYYGGANNSFDFVGLQESKDWQTLYKLSPALSKLKAVEGKVISLYDGNKYTLEKAINSQFEPGRPIQILIFKEKVIFVNLHAPHASSYPKQSLKQYLENKLSSALKLGLNDDKKIDELREHRIIVVGDFNDHHSSLFNDLQKGEFAPFREARLTTPVFLPYVDKNDLLSCCSQSIPYKHPPRFLSDYILDSKPKKSMKSIRLKVPSNYDYDLISSDHLPIIYKTIE